MFPPNPCVPVLGAVLTNLIRPSLGEASPGHTVQCNNTYYPSCVAHCRTLYIVIFPQFTQVQTVQKYVFPRKPISALVYFLSASKSLQCNNILPRYHTLSSSVGVSSRHKSRPMLESQRCNWFLADELCTWKILIKIYYLTSFEPHCSALVTYSFQLIHWRALCPEHISAHERRSTYQRSRMQSLNALLLLGSSCDCLRSSMQPILPLPPFLKRRTTPSNSYS